MCVCACVRPASTGLLSVTSHVTMHSTGGVLPVYSVLLLPDVSRRRFILKNDPSLPFLSDRLLSADGARGADVPAGNLGLSDEQLLQHIPNPALRVRFPDT